MLACGRRPAGAALAQEALELAREDVAGREVALAAGLLLVGGALEALDERLHLRVELDGAGDLAVVVGGGGLEVLSASTVTPTRLSSRRSSASAPFGFGATAT